MKKRDLILLLPPVVVSAIFVFLYYLESFNFENYVFANLHFNLTRFSLTPGIFWAIWTAYFLLMRRVKAESVIIATIFSIFIIPSGIKAAGLVAARTHQMFLGSNYVVQKSMQKMYGGDYKFMSFIKSYLKEDATLLLPPSTPPWRHTGNTQIMNSYLYPIKTTNSTESATPYVLISSETESAPYQLWPDFQVHAREIVIFNWDSGTPTIIKDTDWDPLLWQDKKPWGLIIRK